MEVTANISIKSITYVITNGIAINIFLFIRFTQAETFRNKATQSKYRINDSAKSLSSRFSLFRTANNATKINHAKKYTNPNRYCCISRKDKALFLFCIRIMIDL